MGNNIKDLDALHRVMKGDMTHDGSFYKIGDITHRKDGDYRKVAEGKWVPVRGTATNKSFKDNLRDLIESDPILKGRNVDAILKVLEENGFDVNGQGAVAKKKPMGGGKPAEQMGAGEKASEKPAEQQGGGAEGAKPAENMKGWNKTKDKFGRDQMTLQGKSGDQINLMAREDKDGKPFFTVEGGLHIKEFDNESEAKSYAEAIGSISKEQLEKISDEARGKLAEKYGAEVERAMQNNSQLSGEMIERYKGLHPEKTFKPGWDKELKGYKNYEKLKRMLAEEDVVLNHEAEFADIVKQKIGGKPAEQQGSFYEGDNDDLEEASNELKERREQMYNNERYGVNQLEDAAAPARLTRDTKIRLSQIKQEQTQDKKYNVGETSQRKDGLYKKVAPGKWEPVKGGGSAGAPAGGNSRTDGGLVWRSPDNKHRIHEDNSSGKTKYTLYERGDNYSRIIGEYDSPEAAVAAGEKINAPAGGKAEVNPITGKPLRPETVAYAKQKKAEAEQKRNTEKTAGGFTLAQNDKIKNAALDVITKRRGERLTAKNLKRDYKMSDEEANETVRRVNEYFENLQKARKEFSKK